MGQHNSPVLFFGYQNQAAYGTPATGAHLAFGGEARGRIAKNSNNVKMRSIGSRALGWQKGGGALSAYEATLDSVHSATPLQLAIVSGGVLQWHTVSGGYDDDTDSAFHMQDCKVSTLALRLQAGEQAGVLTATIAGIGRKTVENALVEDPTDPATDFFMSYEARSQLDAAALELDGYDISISNNLRPRWAISGTTRTNNEVRFWDYLEEGVLDVSGNFTRLEPWGSDVHADVIASQTHELLLTNENGGGIIRITVTGLSVEEQAVETPNDGPALYHLPWTAKTVAIAAA